MIIIIIQGIHNTNFYIIIIIQVINKIYLFIY